MTERDYTAFSNAAQGQKDSAGLWVDAATPVDGVVSSDPAQEVNTVAFSGDLDRHRAELRALWGGPICVVEHQHTTAELDEILTSLTQHTWPQLGDRRLVSGGTDPVDDVVNLEVVAATPAIQHFVDAKYGAGVVRVTGWLTAIPHP